MPEPQSDQPAPDPARDPFARYQRQMLLHGWGREGQERLNTSHAVIVGLGALGCQSADHLVRAGCGKVTLIDRDLVEFTNLQRQILYTEEDATLALPKAEAAAKRLRAVNSSITIEAHAADFTSRNALTLAQGADILIDGTDNFETRFLLNDVAVTLGVPFAYAGVIAARGLQMTVLPVTMGERSRDAPSSTSPTAVAAALVPATPCLRCVFEELPPPGSTPTCDTAGVLGPVVAIVAGAQSADALKILAGRADLLSHSMLEFDLWTNTRRRLDLRTLGPRAECVCCGQRRFEFLDGAHESEPAVLCGQNAVQVSPPAPRDGEPTRLDLAALADRWHGLGTITRTAFLVRVRPTGDPFELSVFADGRAIVRGTTSTAAARSMVARFLGA